MSYGPRVDALLDRLGLGLTEQDFAALAIACVDQAGLPVDQQLLVERIIDAHIETVECKGHPAGPWAPVAETAYCDGSCRRSRELRVP